MGVWQYCTCMLPEAMRIKCRHILATEQHVAILKNNSSISEIYSTDHYKNAFHDYALSMPTPQEIESCGPGPFPQNIRAPNLKKTRGRPRTKRIRKWYEALRRKMAKKDGVDPSEQVRSCRLCRRSGHDRRTCPEIARFRNNVVVESKMR